MSVAKRVQPESDQEVDALLSYRGACMPWQATGALLQEHFEALAIS